MKEELHGIPPLNPMVRHFLTRYKVRLLDMPCSRELSALVDCIDFLLEAGKGKEGVGHE